MPDAEVVLDGTDPLENLQWEEYQDGIYRVRLDQPISQLFQYQKMLTPARWPNAHMTDANFFNKRETLRSVSRDSRFGYIIDEDVSSARKPYNKILQPMRESRKNKLSLAARRSAIRTIFRDVTLRLAHAAVVVIKLAVRLVALSCTLLEKAQFPAPAPKLMTAKIGSELTQGIERNHQL